MLTVSKASKNSDSSSSSAFGGPVNALNESKEQEKTLGPNYESLKWPVYFR